MLQFYIPPVATLKAARGTATVAVKKIPVALKYNGRWTAMSLPFALSASYVHLAVSIACIYTHHFVAHKCN